jgi:hypothetical protein
MIIGASHSADLSMRGSPAVSWLIPILAGG